MEQGAAFVAIDWSDTKHDILHTGLGETFYLSCATVAIVGEASCGASWPRCSTMSTIIFSDEDITTWRSWRFQHPDPRVQGRMEALSLRSQGVTHGAIRRLWGISKARCHRHLKAYVAGGVEQLKRIDHDRPQRERANHRTTLDASCQPPPPATVAEAAAKIAEVTGLVRKPTQVRQFLRALGRKPMNVGMLPAKADVDAQEAVQKTPGAQVTGSWGWPARRVFQ